MGMMLLAAIFWMQTSAGWRELIDHRIEGAPRLWHASKNEWVQRYSLRAVGNDRK